jgi:hypothetical protein
MAIVGCALRSLGHPSPVVRTSNEGREAEMDKRENRGAVVERFHEAREERDRRAGQFDAARGSATELPAFTELQAAEEQLAAREAWLKWVDRDY